MRLPISNAPSLPRLVKSLLFLHNPQPTEKICTAISRQCFSQSPAGGYPTNIEAHKMHLWHEKFPFGSTVDEGRMHTTKDIYEFAFLTSICIFHFICNHLLVLLFGRDESIVDKLQTDRWFCQNLILKLAKGQLKVVFLNLLHPTFGISRIQKQDYITKHQVIFASYTANVFKYM